MKNLFKYPGLMILSAAVLTACNNGSSSSNTANPSAYVYVSNHASNSISMYSVTESSGALIPFTVAANGESVVATGLSPLQIAVIPNGQYAYVANSGDNTISMYNITESGLLNPLTGGAAGGPTVPTQSNPRGIAVSPGGAYAYVPNEGDNTVSMYSIAESGLLLPLLNNESAIFAGASPFSMVINSLGTYAYVVNFNFGGTGSVSMFSISESGLLSALSNSNEESSVATQAQPEQIILNPNGTYAYVVNETSSSISMYSINNGILAPLSESVFALPGNSFPHSLSIDPSGAYVYVSGTTSGVVYTLLIGANGELQQVESVAATVAPYGILAGSVGSYAYVANSVIAGSILMYSIGAGGILAPLYNNGESSVAAQGEPRYITYSPGY